MRTTIVTEGAEIVVTEHAAAGSSAGEDFPTLDAALDRSKTGQFVYYEGGKFHLADPDKAPRGAKPVDGMIRVRKLLNAEEESVVVAAEAGGRLAPGYYAIRPGGGIESGPHTTIGPAKTDANRVHGYVQFEAGEQPAAGEVPYLIPYIHMERDADAYAETLANANKLGPIGSGEDVYRVLGPALGKEDQEVLGVMLVDVRGQCMGFDEVARGARDHVDVSIGRVMTSVVIYRPHHFIVVHNHPSGKASPSKADRDLTERIRKAAEPYSADSAFVDHVVIGTGEFYSFADEAAGKRALHKVKG